MMRRTTILWVVLLVNGILLAPPQAEAAFPGANGKIVFRSTRDGGNFEIYSMNADGSGQVNLTNMPGAADDTPVWSPDGTKIAFRSNRDGGDYEIYVMNADGSGQTNLSNSTGTDNGPTWSPDGTRIAFWSQRDPNAEVYVMNADGSGQTNLTQNGGFDESPAWSPDGTKIAFVSNRDANNEVYVMNADGSGQTNLTQNLAGDTDPSWSPDGTKIAFETDRDSGVKEIYVMNADGSGQTNITNNGVYDYDPSWAPDGTAIAFETDRDVDSEIYVMNPDGSAQTNVSNFPGAHDRYPDWQRIKLAKKVTLKAKPKSVEEGQKTRLKARVSPCEGHEGDLVEFYRKKKRIATKKSNASCVAVLKVVMKSTTKFKAVSPVQDFDFLAGTSKPVKVRVLEA